MALLSRNPNSPAPSWLNTGVEALGLALAFLPTLLVRLLRPAILVRFSRLPTGRIGMLASYPEVYLSERDAGMHRTRGVDLFYPDAQVSNAQLLKMWKRKLHIWPVVRPMAKLNQWLPGKAQHQIPWRDYPATETVTPSILPPHQEHIRFTFEEERQGQAQLRQLGIPQGAPFVCFHARDPAYLESRAGKEASSRHNCRDSSIHNYVPAAEELTRRGYFAIRMGSIVKEPLDTPNPMIIDYATRGATEFLDIYLSSNCKYFISSPTGLSTLPMMFRRPCARVNHIPLGAIPTWGPNDICILKKLWCRGERRMLTFQEIFDRGLAEVEISSGYGIGFDEVGIDVVENTPEEITSIVVEMDQRLKGTWRDTAEDEGLQNRFWSIIQPSKQVGAFSLLYVAHGQKRRSRIGAEFLRQNKGLLD
jgi:putative glycosyltransferase (TIGR04372 family)